MGDFIMAKELSFWKYCEEGVFPHNEVYVRLSDGEVVDEVAKLPTSRIREAIDSKFSEWEKLDEDTFERDEEAFQIFMTGQMVRFDCYGMTEQHMNELIDIMLSFKCCLYDSAIDVRFCHSFM